PRSRAGGPALLGASIGHAKAGERACGRFDRIGRGFLTGIDNLYGGAGPSTVGWSTFSRDAFRDIDAIERNAGERHAGKGSVGADRRVVDDDVSSVCPLFPAQVSLRNSNGRSCGRLLGASAGDEISDPLTHLPLVSPTLAAG